jgi:integrase
MAPRCQVFQQLRLGSSFSKEADGLYFVKMLAEQSKNGKPTLFPLAKQLTPAYDAYFEVVRPRLIAAALLRRSDNKAPADLEHDYVFCKRNGTAPRLDFSMSTNLVTQAVLGRPINAHAFRSSVITAVYSAGASQADMNMLANIMAHDPATARNFYYKPQHSLAAVKTGQRLAEQLLAAPAADAAAAAATSSSSAPTLVC